MKKTAVLIAYEQDLNKQRILETMKRATSLNVDTVRCFRLVSLLQTICVRIILRKASVIFPGNKNYFRIMQTSK